jgi:hypothetical protein
MDEVQVSLQILCPELDAAGLADLTQALRREILAVDVDGVQLAAAGPVPVGGKSGEVIAIGALAVTLAPMVIESMIGVVSSWLSRQPNDVEIEIDGHRFKGRVTKAQRNEIVAAYLRHLGEPR